MGKQCSIFPCPDNPFSDGQGLVSAIYCSSKHLLALSIQWLHVTMNASVLYTQNIKLNWEEKVITLWHYQEPGEGEEDWKLDPPSAALHCM